MNRLRPAVAALALLATACSGPAPPAVPVQPAPSGNARAGPTLPADCGGRPGEVAHQPSVDPAYGGSADYRVYLPPCYAEQSARRYPVLVMLHGGSVGDEFWSQVGIAATADTLIRTRAIPPLLIVMPDGGPLLTSDLPGAPSFEELVVDSLLPAVRRRWRIAEGRSSAAIGGNSIGGRLALQITAAHPEEFAAVGGHSTTVHGALELAGGLQQAGVRIYLDVGSRDPLLPDVAALSAALTGLGVTHEFHVSDGAHDRVYWAAHVPDYLRFYAAGFP